MKKLPFRRRILPALIAAPLLTACMNSTMGVNDTDSKSTSVSSDSSASSSRTVEGTVATGAFAAGVKVTAFDGKGAKCGEATSNENGAFRIESQCAGPLLLISETGKSEGQSLYSVANANARSMTNITSLTSLVVALALGDDPVAAKRGFGDLLSDDNIATAQDRLRSMLAPALAAFSADKADFLTSPLAKGVGLDALMDQADFQIDADPDTQQYALYVRLPILQRPIILRNRIGAKPASAWFDEAYGRLPSAISADQVQKSGEALQEITTWFNEFIAAPNRQGAIDGCFRHDGGTSPSALFSPEKDGSIKATNVRLLRYNTHGNFLDEDFEAPNAGSGTLAYISADQVDNLGRRITKYTWLIKGSQSVDGCASSGTGWRLLGNQHRVKVLPISYAEHRIEYGHALSNRIDEKGTGLEFYITGAGEYSHAQVNGPGLPANGVVLVNKEGAFVRYNGTLINLRSSTDIKQILDSVVKPLTRSIALSDEDISPTNKSPLLGITNALYDAHNTYVFRIFRNKDDRAPELVYTQVLEKRPYLTAEMDISYFPVLAVHLDQLTAALVRFDPVTLAWSPSKDLLGNDFQLSAVWLSRFGTWKHQKCDPNCVDVTDTVENYVLPGSYRFMTPGIDQISTQGQTVNGTLEKGYAHFEVLDSYRRPVRTVVGINQTR